MRFSSLNPEWSNEQKYISFDCPCHHPKCHRVCIPIDTRGSGGWDAIDRHDFEKITINPSIRRIPNEIQCGYHFNVVLGEIQFHPSDSIPFKEI